MVVLLQPPSPGQVMAQVHLQAARQAALALRAWLAAGQRALAAVALVAVGPAVPVQALSQGRPLEAWQAPALVPETLLVARLQLSAAAPWAVARVTVET